MSDEAPAPNFIEFLKCDLPEGFPVVPPITWPITEKLRDGQRTELLRVKIALLARAEETALTHPWLAYLAAVKHEVFFDILPAAGLVYNQIAWQKAYNESQARWKALRRSSRAQVDDPTAHFCERLVNLQRNATRIVNAEKVLGVALKAGFRALEPLPPAPTKTVPSSLSAPLSLGKKAEEDAAIRVWQRQDAFLQICEKELNIIRILTPATRAHGLKDLPATLITLADFRDERAALEATYVTPYETPVPESAG